ncbi:MAG TPA: winged helix DNA-binding domain-containing protein [Puia sp.]|uniref:winged helix DNA-binding domain-containing protein n=1 Tax=Puia sp. TaxID=2045100 RepID=UPI002D116A49|nr:winged helix DNA-binding domain-containing protein [Puia sp.]HVU98402.1 winged helix DNA-binding domain-containing protein [Puia sp.]
MKAADLLAARMRSQGMADVRFADAESLLAWMGCMQAQDFGQAKWAVGMRCGLTEMEIDTAFNEGRLLRTHVLRPTWHFVLPADVGWMLRLTASRVKNFCLPYHRKLGIDAAILKRSKKVMIRGMEGGIALTRMELAALLRAAKIDTSEIRMNFLLMDAELDGLICSGPRKGKQFTYALLRERAPVQVCLDGDAALAELTRRYFMSRGPATEADLAWWGGMTLGQARRGLEIVGKELERVRVGEVEYWRGGNVGPGGMKEVVLLPAYDEYAVGYKDRGEIVPAEHVKQTFHGLKPVVLVRGRVAGMWKRRVEKGKVVVEASPLDKWNKATEQGVKKEVRRFEAFATSGLSEK